MSFIINYLKNLFRPNSNNYLDLNENQNNFNIKYYDYYR